MNTHDHFPFFLHYFGAGIVCLCIICKSLVGVVFILTCVISVVVVASLLSCHIIALRLCQPSSLLPWAWVLEQSLRVRSPSLCGISVTAPLQLVLRTCFVDGCVLPPFLSVMSLSFNCSCVLVIAMRLCQCYHIVLLAYVFAIALVLRSCWSVALVLILLYCVVACIAVVASVLHFLSFHCSGVFAIVSLLLHVSTLLHWSCVIIDLSLSCHSHSPIWCDDNYLWVKDKLVPWCFHVCSKATWHVEIFWWEKYHWQNICLRRNTYQSNILT